LSGSIPAALGNLNGLLNLYLDSNLFIGDLPDLSDFPYLSELSVENNQFTFSSLSSTGIIPSAIDEFSYSPQDTVFGLQYQFLNNSLTVLDDVETGNIYNWYRDTVLLEEEDRIITLTGEGGYHCEVGNILYPDLKILSDTFSFSYSVLTDSVSLVTLYNETNGSSWINKSNWLTGRLNTWYGVTLDVNNRGSKLILNGNNLTDTIPAEIGESYPLNRVKSSKQQFIGRHSGRDRGDGQPFNLMLNSNQFSGEIPAEIGNLKKLSTLYLDNNQFTGSIPVILGNLTNLTRLTLHSNNFSGIIPTQLSNCTKLIVLNLGKNNLSGSIPESFVIG
jgi:Leucine-rich repeat (LRR) protein